MQLNRQDIVPKQVPRLQGNPFLKEQKIKKRI